MRQWLVVARDEEKHFFGPVPGRAGSDLRLSALQFRVLMVIAGKDRMSRNGQGCWASQETLKRLVGCDGSRLSAAINDLRSFGYLTIHRSDDDARQKGYRVVYDNAADAIGIGADSLRNGKLSKGQGTLRNGKLSTPKSTLRNGNVISGDSLRNGKLSGPDTLPKSKVSRTHDLDLSSYNMDLADTRTNLIYSVETEDITRSGAGDEKSDGKARAELAAKLGTDGWSVLLHLSAEMMARLTSKEKAGEVTSADLATAREAAAAARRS